MAESVRYTVNIPVALHRRAKALSAAQGDHLSDIVREALANYVAESSTDDSDLIALVRERLSGLEQAEFVTWEDAETELDELEQSEGQAA